MTRDDRGRSHPRIEEPRAVMDKARLTVLEPPIHRRLDTLPDNDIVLALDATTVAA